MTICLPEFWLAFFSFLLHFAWEMLQTPTYAGMAEMPHWDATILCLQATLGDVLFALIAFWLASAAARSRRWYRAWPVFPTFVYMAAGLLLTIGFEFYYTEVSLRWTYSAIMPRLPLLGTGVSPLVQWILIPPLALWLTRRHLANWQNETAR